MVKRLLAWQWEGYPAYHRSRTNLKIHIVAVPAFLVANVWMVVALLSADFLFAGVAFGLMALSMVMQGKGHDLEELPPEPFAGPGQAVARILLEQWITFPRFVVTGGWRRALRAVPA